MATSEQCSECGANISSTERGGLCARCLLSLGLSDAVNALGVPDEDRGSPEPQHAGSFEAGPSPVQAAAGGDTRAPEPQRRFGDYDLLEEIARGGGGIVYRARQRSLNRIVALKLLVFGAAASPEVVRRFRVEASAAGALQHPNIVAIHEVGLHQGQHYLAMDFVDGPNLAQAISDLRFTIYDFQRTARCVKQIAEAVHYAHERGILHRDLKPSNVLLGADDQPHVTDFGLAKRFGVPPSGGPHGVPASAGNASASSTVISDSTISPAEAGTPSDLTLTGQVIGSPAYMPPEQATADHRRVGRSSDAYSLGAILYHLLTGRPPFQAATPAATMHQVLHADPITPRLLQPGVPADLETICLKCLEKEPAKRYPTAQSLADELGRFLRDEPIHARPVGRVEKAWRWCRRKPALATSLSVIVLLLLLVIVGSPIAAYRIDRERQRAEQQSIRAEDNAANERRERYYASIAAADSHIRNGDIDVALNVLTNCPPELRHWEWGRLLYQCHQSVSTTRLTNASIESLIVNCDGTRAAGTVSGSPNSEAMCWAVETGRELLRFGGPDQAVDAMTFSADGRRLAMARLDGLVKVWDAETGQEEATFNVTNRVSTIRFDPDGRHLCVTTADQRSTIRDVSNGDIRFATPTLRDQWVASALDPQGRAWATMDKDGIITLRDARTGAPRFTVRGYASASLLILSKPVVLFISPDARWLVANRSTSSAKVWAIESGQEVFDIPSRIYAVAFNAAGTRLATLTGNKTAEVWDIATATKILTLRGHESAVCDVRFSPDGRRVITADSDGVVKTWSADLGRERIQLDSPVDSVAFSPDGRRFATTQMDGVTRLWETDSGRELRAWRGNWSWCRAVSFSPDGRRILTAGADRRARIWDSETGRELVTMRGHTGAIRDAVFSPDGQTVATAGWDATARIWDAQTGEELRTLRGHTAGIRPLVFSPDGRRLVTAGLDGFARVWESATGRSLLALKASSTALGAVAFSPDGRKIATGSYGRSIRIWDSQTGQNLATWKTRSRVQWLHYSPDGKRLVALVSHNLGFLEFPSIEILDAETGRQILALQGHASLDFSAQFSPDGLRLLNGCSDRTVKLWEAFPWREEPYPGSADAPLLDRVRGYADEYWRKRVAAEGLAIHAAEPSNSPAFFRLPPSAWPNRDERAGAHLIDLSDHYNALLDVPGHAIVHENYFDNDLSTLPAGLHVFSDIQFDVRGMILLRGAPRPNLAPFEKRFLPEMVGGIKVASRFQRFHLLHGAQNSTTLPDNTPLCRYLLHYADGGKREIDVIYGRDVRDWWEYPNEPRKQTDRGAVAWRGTNPTATLQGATLRLYLSTFENPRPESMVESIDFASTQTPGNPFLIALTVDP